VNIASIAGIEIPRKEFLELIPNLNANSNSALMDIRLASLETLSRVCEEVSAEYLTTELKNLVVTALVTNFKTELDSVKATQFALNGFLSGLEYAKGAFEVKSDRDVIISSLFKTLNVADEDIKFTTMQIFVEIARSQYDIVEFYLNDFMEATAFCARSTDEKIGAQAIEFWTSLGEEEYRRI
jgi:hypothetical protein